MKIMTPHLGNTYLVTKAVFDTLGIDYIIPEFNSKKSLEIGSMYSPDDMCLPFKLMMGNYIQGIEQGADTIIITGSCGPCRYGEYCELQINTLKKLGHNLNFIVLDKPSEIGPKEFLNRISSISSSSDKNMPQKLNALRIGFKVLNLIDKIEAKAHYLAGYEKNKNECKKLLSNCKIDAENSNSPNDMIKILNKYDKRLDSLEVCSDRNPIKVAIIGEIYTIIEPFSNLFIEDKLMEYGVSTQRKLTPSWWAKNSIMSVVGMNSLDIRKASKEYLPLYIGGHARECIGEAVMAAHDGFDGAIQIFPMGCMPEIVCKAVLPSISKDKNFPILTLVVDEMTGETGYITRIEAFLDLLERRKQKCII
ncbi:MULTISPECIES: 2-hydroxyglutaryl-CoA dehydratase [Clostridium]|uniref:2-hydroxyglutaryl-CoA dehydratase n=1 Tax=Clostridium diolis TaxID=223919 RepID=A0AAV3W9C3_9CLOT|nr:MULTISPECIES: 2-hydroxyglutaryl-CoA dehydratase [Clostridium]ALB44811.1 2-hydroxyglutaryl-CoA dehydratase [Clostridium beijerinckii NRRL B-598]NOW87614.1 putative nucleotide-binding protein (sugar kinase/HSP70/actin superfamily) [Clostridium beijerinckii]QES75062.1 2-hydroxyglutaryl-CoA dehydratase [Clostridium diolis]GEA33877.1 2-hydroxyglutaryl-CoA dehydratase [Clostridium diolis]